MTDRDQVIAAAMDDVRVIEGRLGVTREGVGSIRDRLVELARDTAVFNTDEFPAPEDPGQSFMYRVAQDDDDRFALYVQSSSGSVASPPHNHTTWAVVTGVSGSELNRFYERSDDGVTQVDEHLVQSGTGVAMLPDDVHSISLEEPSVNLHCYGLALERLVEREYYSERTQSWKIYTAVGSVVEARTGHVSAE